MTTKTYTQAEADQIMADAGYSADDQYVVITSLMDAGLELDQPDEGTIYSQNDLDAMLAQLAQRC